MKASLALRCATFCLAVGACGAQGGQPVTLDSAAEVSALEVNGDGSDVQTSDATGDAPETDRDCSPLGARKRLLAEYDSNHDGKLDKGELAALRADFGDAHFHLHNAARRSRLELLTHLYDDNGDGTLEANERANLEQDLEVRCENRKQEELAEYDSNGDGQLEDDEWQKLFDDLEARWKSKRAAILTEFDQNKDGKFEPAERQLARETLAQQIEDAWLAAEAAHDTNGDGKLEPDERAALVADLKVRLRAPAQP